MKSVTYRATKIHSIVEEYQVDNVTRKEFSLYVFQALLLCYYKETHDSYLKFLERHLMFFVKNDFMSVTTVNTTEMEKDCPLYSRLYIIYHSKTDYLLYNRDVQPFVTINHRV